MSCRLKNKDNETIEDSEDFTRHKADTQTLSSGLKLRRGFYDKLFEYQVEGVNYLYQNFLEKTGCILADDMGLGKTIQTIAFISSLFESKLINYVLIVVPTTLMIFWETKFSFWSPGVNVYKISSSSSKTARSNALHFLREEGGVLLISYDLCRNYSNCISFSEGKRFIWDYVILDEGHKIRNVTQVSDKLHNICSRNRVVLTGTPIQNNLREMWALFNFVSQGSLLGTYQSFKQEIEKPLLLGQQKNRLNNDIVRSEKTAHILRKMCAPYIMRRTKDEVLKQQNVLARLPEKVEYVVWIKLSKSQIIAYEDFLKSSDMRQIISRNNRECALVTLGTLKKLCDHPQLTDTLYCRINKSPSNTQTRNIATIDVRGAGEQELISDSGKLSFCIYLLEQLIHERNKVLCFSQSTKMLDILENVFRNRNWKWLRLDGSVTVEKRNEMIDHFQTDASVTLFLLSTHVSNVGLTLTSANRVIIYDPCWNPATDMQAVDRAYRIGQKNNVIVYRLITCGTVEEHIYRRQIFKTSITQQVLEKNDNVTRYFTAEDLRGFFRSSNYEVSETFDLICDVNAKTVHDKNSHLMFLMKSSSVYNVQNHTALFCEKEAQCRNNMKNVDHIKDNVVASCNTLC